MSDPSRNRLWIRLPRSVLAAFFFFAFGVGGLLMGLVLFPLLVLFGRGRRVKRSMRSVVRFCYKLFVGVARVTGLFCVVISPDDHEKITSLRGCVVVANHLTLIDVIILISYLPDSTAVAKAAAGRNFFYARVVNAAFIVNDNPMGVIDEAKRLLSGGTNIVIFPEGTRTPSNVSSHKLHRGAAQIALHAGVPVHCIGMTCDPPVLAKGQPWWDVADRIIEFKLADRGEILVSDLSVSHSSAVALTDQIRTNLF